MRSASDGIWNRRVEVEPGAPFSGQALTLRRAYAPAAYDWLEVIVVLEGTGRCHHGKEGPDHLKPGAVVFLRPNVPCVVEPEGQIVLVRLFYAADFLLQQVQWQYSDEVPDEWAARVMAERLYPQPSQVVTVGEGAEFDIIREALSDFAQLVSDRQVLARYYRALSGATAVLGVVVPKLSRRTAESIQRQAELARRPTLACMAAIRPTREEIRRAREWIVRHFSEQFTVAELAKMTGLSRQQFSRRFRQEIGKTPMTFRDAVRVRQMVFLLIESSLTVAQVTRKVGWGKTDHAIRVFKAAVGVTPAVYRKRFCDHLSTDRYPDAQASYPDPLVFEH
ncbi:MAG: AraC family transcriptional regulator [Bifidobacteriaceae bacterium]|nr:AraC family transcriptional regulator [Bifidobacteriaceae bacterium]